VTFGPLICEGGRRTPNRADSNNDGVVCYEHEQVGDVRTTPEKQMTNTKRMPEK